MSVSGFMLERYATGDLSEAERAIVDAELERNPAAKARVEQLRTEREAFLADNPYRVFAAANDIRRGETGARRRWWGYPVFALGAAAAAIMLFIHQPTERIKGDGAALTMTLVNDPKSPQRLLSGEQVHPGDRLQPTYDAGDYGFVALLGRDPSGMVTTYFPTDRATMAPLPNGPRGVFPLSLTLDAALGDESFVAVFADKPLPLTEVEAAARQTRTPEGAVSSAATVRKVP